MNMDICISSEHPCEGENMTKHVHEAMKRNPKTAHTILFEISHQFDIFK